MRHLQFLTYELKVWLMPIKSEAQRRWLHATNPKMAAEWEAHTEEGKKLPKKVHKKKAK